MIKKALALAVCTALVGCGAEKSEESVQVEKKTEQTVTQAALTYPETKKGEVVDTYFDTQVADPYRWLEDDMSEETAQWV